MNFSRYLLIPAAVSLCLTAFGNTAAAKKPRPVFQIKFATLAPEGSAWMKTMHAVDGEIRLRTDNRLGFKLYPGGVQGDEKEVLRKIRNGQLHGGGFTGFGLGSVVPEVRVQELPFMFQSHDELDHLRRELNPSLRKAFGEKGFLHLGWADVGFVYLFSRNPIRSPEDMSTARIWVWSGDRLAELFFRAFGIAPVPLAAPDVLTSLRTGIIDTVYGSPLACVALQWFTRVEYMTDVPVTHSLGAALVSAKALKKVAPADVEVLLEVSQKHLRDLTKRTRVQNREAVEVMEKEGVKIITVEDAVRSDFFSTGRNAWDEGVGRLYSQELLDHVREVLEAYRGGG